MSGRTEKEQQSNESRKINNEHCSKQNVLKHLHIRKKDNDTHVQCVCLHCTTQI